MTEKPHRTRVVLEHPGRPEIAHVSIHVFVPPAERATAKLVIETGAASIFAHATPQALRDLADALLTVSFAVEEACE